MNAHLVAEGVYCLHANIQTTDLFEGIWPIPRGVSLNTYLVRGEKTALIDLVRDWDGAADSIEDGLASIGLKTEDLDYLILNHLEPDHTGWLGEFRKKNPRAEILATAKGLALVKSFYKVDTGLRAISNGDTLDLGGRTLSFIEAPNIHWPETMLTWDSASGTLFSCDAFGSFGALNTFDGKDGSRLFDDEFTPEEHAFFEEETLRYYANILSSFSAFVEKAVEKTAGLTVSCVAPSHGMVWRKNPKTIIDRYLEYASYAKKPKQEIALIWGSMYGNTKAGLDAVIRGIEREGVPHSIYRVPDENVSYVLSGAYKSAGLVIAMPTYEYAIFPPMAYVLDLFRRKHIFNKTVLRIGSWGWVGGAKKEYDALLPGLKWNSLESLEWSGYPAEADLAALEERGRELALAVKSL